MKLLLQLVAALLVIAGCSTTTEPTPTDPTDDLVLIGKDTASSLEISVYLDAAPHVGMNALRVRIISLPSGTAMTSATLRVDPTMPSMGHGSPGNVHPVHHDAGWYQGTCNFTMTGDWDLALRQMDHDTAIHTIHFPVLVR